MKKLFLASVAAMIAVPVLAADITIAVTAIVEHPALDATRDGVKDGLAKAGFVDGDKIDFVYESAQGQPATAAQIARQFVGDEVTIIVPISTPSAQAAIAATRDNPIVFTAVTDPVGAQLVDSLEKPGGNVTGLSDLAPLQDHIDLMREVLPDIKNLGVIFNPGEPNSVSLVTVLKELAGPAGLTIVESAATNSASVQQATRALAGRVDAIYVPTDNTVVSAFEAVVGVAEENDIPLFAGDTDSVKRGAIATVGFDYYNIGLQTAEAIVRVLNGENPGDIAVVNASGTDLFVNPGAAERMGITIPEAVVGRANTVVE